MTLPEVASNDEWSYDSNIELVARHLIEGARASGIPIEALGTDPLTVLQETTPITVRFREQPGQGCSVYGHYDDATDTITVQRSGSFRRDNFTLLHEYGHRLQSHDVAWASKAWRLPSGSKARIVEDISDVIASLILIPDEAIAEHLPNTEITASGLAAVHRQAEASAQAVLVRATRAQTTGNDGFALLCDPAGTVLFSTRLGEDVAPPPKGSIQEDIRRLTAQALSSNLTAAGMASHGIAYSTGSLRSDIRLDVVATDQYVFVVGRKENRYGTPQWGKQEIDCPSPACNEVFVVDATVATCRKCLTPRCPHCRTCACEPAAAAICNRCYQTLSAYDITKGRTTHEDCD